MPATEHTTPATTPAPEAPTTTTTEPTTPAPMRADVSRTRAYTRAREAASTSRIGRLIAALMAHLRAITDSDSGTRSPITDRPASLAELLAYTRAGNWVPGIAHPALEAAGKAYGFLLALPLSAVLYALAWVVQRPSRLAVVAVLTAVIRFT